MRTQPIQANNNNSFQTRFINDNNGHYRKVWQDAVLDIDLANMIDKFAKNNKSHLLEITDVLFNQEKKYTTYTNFNHKNGFGLSIEAFNSSGFVLHEILDKISQSQLLTNKIQEQRLCIKN